MTSVARPGDRFTRPMTILIGVLGVSAIAISMWMARYTRFVFDDFELAAQFRDMGWLKLSKFMFENYSGRLVLILFGGVVTHLGPNRVVWVGCVSVLTWWISIGAVVRQSVLRLRGVLSWGQAGALSAALTGAVLVTVPDRFETFRWATGSLVYGIPVVLGTAALGLGLWSVDENLGRLPRVLATLASTVLLILSSGGNESQAVSQPAICLLLFVCAIRSPNSLSCRRWQATCWCVGSLLGAALLLLSPGSRNRAGWLDVSHEPSVLLRSCVESLQVLGAVFVGSILGLLALFGLGRLLRTIAGAPRAADETVKRSLRLIAFSLLPAIGVSTLIPAWAMNAPAPLRAYLPLQVLLGAAAVLVGWRSHLVVGVEGTRNVDQEFLRILPVVTCVVALVGPAMLVRAEASQMTRASDQASDFDCIDRSLASQAAQGAKHLVVNAYTLDSGYELLYEDPTRRPNVVASMYYRVGTIVGNKGGDPCELVGPPPSDS